MLDPIAIQKEKELAETPLLLLDLTFGDGTVYRWATHAADYGDCQYEARVLRHNFFEIQAMSEQGTDRIPRLTLVLANADSQMSQLEQGKGFRGADLTATLVFYDLAAGQAGPDSLVVFSGYCNPPEEITDLQLKVTVVNRMNLQRVILPPVKLQRRCPWRFPSTASERQAAAFDPNSLFYPCGYSADVPGGRGRLASPNQCFSWCGYNRQACIERGMFNHDAGASLAAPAGAGATSILVTADLGDAGQTIDVGGGADPQTHFAAMEEVQVTAKEGNLLFISPALRKSHAAGEPVGRPTRRFGGMEYVPEAIDVRPFGSPFFLKSPVYGAAARYNDHIPSVYGTAWVEPVVTVLRNDGNLTRMEAIVSLGRISGILRVVVNDFEIPPAIAGRDMTGSGWYTLVSDGGPWGGFDLNFTDRQGNPQGDPYGSIAYLSIVVPNQVNDGKSVPRVHAFVNGRLLETFSIAGQSLGYSFTNNTAWVLLDLLKLASWETGQMDLASFARAATFCGELIPATDNEGNPVSVPRFQCNLVLRQRRNAAEVVQGVRSNARLYFTYSSSGKLQAGVENTIALEQATLPYGSNATVPVAGGWPAYVYSETNGTIVRRADGSSSVRVSRRPISDTPNRLAFEFQDVFNQYVQDSFAIDDVDDQKAVGQEISQTLLVEGIPTFDQAARMGKFQIDKAVRGNTFVEFETSIKAVGQQASQIIALGYAREGWDNQLFRILRIAPQQNYRRVRITAQIHDDAWYSDANTAGAAAASRSRQARRGPRPPNPLIGTEPRADGDMNWAIEEKQSVESDGTGSVELSVGFAVPATSVSARTGPPTADPVATTQPAGGSLAGGQTLFYRLTATDPDGLESAPSTFIRAAIPEGGDTNAVLLTGLRLDSAASSFDVYRGSTPSKMFGICEGHTPASTFRDTGFEARPVPPPDVYFDHAVLYWKRQLLAPVTADTWSSETIGNSALELVPGEFAGCLVRIAEGTGAGQVRIIASNTGTVLTIDSPWAIEPDAGSVFFVEEPDWKSGSSAVSSPARFRVPNRKDEVLLVQGRAADAQNAESPEMLAAVTAWTIGGVGAGITDTGVPPEAVFGVSTARDGNLTVGPMAFGTLTNTSGITSATCHLFYADEIGGAATEVAQPGGIDSDDTSLEVSSSAGFQAGDLVVIGEEICGIDQINGLTWTVRRGQNRTVPAPHPHGARIDLLRVRTLVLPMEPGLIGSPWAGGTSSSVRLPCARLAGAELSATNSFGSGPAAYNNYLGVVSEPGLPGSLPGLRTNCGGQYTMQMVGIVYAAAQPGPDITVSDDASVRDVFAFVDGEPQGAPLIAEVWRNGTSLATLTVAEGETLSDCISGASLPPLRAGDRLNFAITGVGSVFAGLNLTIVIRK